MRDQDCGNTSFDPLFRKGMDALAGAQAMLGAHQRDGARRDDGRDDVCAAADLLAAERLIMETRAALLMLRAVREGDQSAGQARREAARLRAPAAAFLAPLPQALRLALVTILTLRISLSARLRAAADAAERAPHRNASHRNEKPHQHEKPRRRHDRRPRLHLVTAGLSPPD